MNTTRTLSNISGTPFPAAPVSVSVPVPVPVPMKVPNGPEQECSRAFFRSACPCASPTPFVHCCSSGSWGRPTSCIQGTECCTVFAPESWLRADSDGLNLCNCCDSKVCLVEVCASSLTESTHESHRQTLLSTSARLLETCCPLLQNE